MLDHSGPLSTALMLSICIAALVVLDAKRRCVSPFEAHRCVAVPTITLVKIRKLKPYEDQLPEAVERKRLVAP